LGSARVASSAAETETAMPEVRRGENPASVSGRAAIGVPG